MNCDTLSERAAIARCALSTVTMAQFSNYSNLAVVYFRRNVDVHHLRESARDFKFCEGCVVSSCLESRFKRIGRRDFLRESEIARVMCTSVSR